MDQLQSPRDPDSQDLLKAERELSELREIQREIAEIAERQGVQLSTVEASTKDVIDHIETAELDLSAARKFQHSRRSTIVYVAVAGVMLINLPIGLTLGASALAISAPTTILGSATALIANYFSSPSRTVAES